MESDSIVERFLNFLACDIEQNPQYLKAVSPNLVARIQSLIAGVYFDLDTPLSEEDE
jgi:antitoxin PrlF